ncbi:gastrula zinc finger protein XlCGF7.1-like [Ischnura elegans]|uniref:gastrula zinc finger protein XlCGF7.1-like n=1 Tax=Ischnura elegans TaxID=197161 RepID=UPI001ED87850|nr:gastrula zinc finger protein XlCGF7.1-like [Ischnura elegans]XP_046404956.1 gastrula zinc finger protein XlCGF7.1-like [Ischnura elegans]XP_046404957.1 gastrula zinc finger protein XlCGF7.1-like [Ischnura elegans]XP_046404959.1 gastrula zinc finger protein XlCGF7.1-like [Ischnura elegans]
MSVADASPAFGNGEHLQDDDVLQTRGVKSEKKDFRCESCDRSFTSASRLESHRNASACRAPFPCRLCAIELHGANELARHAEAVHADPRMCVLCGRLLSRKDKLENHVRTHTGEQPFECSYCGQHFSRRDRCNEHEKLHQGVSFRCGECQRSFSRRDKMRAHLLRAHHEQTVTQNAEWVGQGTMLPR